MKKILYFILPLLIFFVGCSQNSSEKSQKPQVVVTTFAIYDVAKSIAQDDIDVSMLIPFGKEVHSFEPTPKDIIKLKKSAYFFYNGAGLEPWAEKFADGNKGVDLSRYVDLKKATTSHHHHGDKEHGAIDPHYWLDFENMQKIADTIAHYYAQLLPQKKELFFKRAQKYKKMLQELDKKYKRVFNTTCKKKEIFVNHNAYSYLASRYGFGVDSLVGLSPEAQPSPKVIEETIKQIRKEGVKVVFCENFENKNILESVARDTGVKMEILKPLANITADDAKKGESYQSLMLQNLKKIADALECDGV